MAAGGGLDGLDAPPYWPASAAEDLKGGDAAYNAEALRRVLEGETSAFRDAAVLTAAAAILVAGEAANLKQAVDRAQDAINSGAALKSLDTLVKVSNS